MKIKQVRKALVPAIVALVLGVLEIFGVMSGMSVQEAVFALVTSVIVWAVPNDLTS